MCMCGRVRADWRIDVLPLLSDAHKTSPLGEHAEQLQRVQLAARLAVLPSAALLTLQVANARPSQLDLEAAKKAGGAKDAKAAAEALKAARAKASKAMAASDVEAKKDRASLALSFQEVSARI